MVVDKAVSKKVFIKQLWKESPVLCHFFFLCHDCQDQDFFLIKLKREADETMILELL